MKKPSLTGGLLLACGAVALIAVSLTVPHTGVSRAEAGELALKHFSAGTIQDTELIREKGHLIWCVSVIPAAHSNVNHVFIDANSRELVELKVVEPDKLVPGETKHSHSIPSLAN